MAKPSIFSSSYKKEMEKRKKRRNIVLIVLVVGLISFGIYRFGKNTIDDFNKGIVDNDGNTIKTEEDNNSLTTQKTEEDKIKEKEEEEKNKLDEKEILVEDKVIGKVSSKTSSDIIEAVDLADENYIYDLNYSKNLGIVYDSINQRVYSFNRNGEVKEITYPLYRSTKGIETTREAALLSKKDFVWMKDTKFIGDSKVIYTTNLPWFNSTLYLWFYDVEGGSFDRVRFNGNMLSGNNIEILENTLEYLRVSVDNIEYKVDTSGVATRE